MNRLLIAVCSLLIFSSCHFFHGERVNGTGNVVTQTRTLSNFEAVDVSSAIEVHVKQDSSYSVKVETDDNLQQYIIISEDNGTLRIRQKDNTSLDPTGKIKVYVSAPSFKRLEASGACEIIGENKFTTADAVTIHLSGASNAKLELQTAKVSTDLTGASSMTLAGETKDFSINASGSSHVKAYDLISEKADIDISGACSVEVYANVNVDAKASGASEIWYKGSASVDAHTSGASSARKAN